MISFKTFLKIRYPEFEYEYLTFVPVRPDITSMVRNSIYLSDTPDIINLLYKGYLAKLELLNKTS